MSPQQKVKLVRSRRLSDVAEYAYSSIAPKGSCIVTLAGACPLNADGTTAAVGSYAGQAKKSLENMSIILEEMGLSITDVTGTKVLVASNHQKDLIEAWEVVRDYFGEHDVPSTLMGVAALGYDDQLVEIEVMAAMKAQT